VSNLRAFPMPKWGIEMIEGTIGEWKVQQGDKFAKGQTIALIETDKIVNEVEAEFEATVARLIAMPGTTYAVGTLLGVFATGKTTVAEVDEFIRQFKPSEAAANAGAEKEPTSAPAKAAAPKPAAIAIPAGLAISPAARAFVTEHAVKVDDIRGSGRAGRITLQDAIQASKPLVQQATGQPVSVVLSTAALDSFYASPMAKRIALQQKVDLAKLKGTGPRGRISRQDVIAASGAKAPAAKTAATSASQFEVVRMSPMRKAIARQLTLSKSTIPHFYLRLEANIDALLDLRKSAKTAAAAPSLNDYFVRAAALALLQAPDVNVQVHGEEIHRFRHADIAVAVATDRGLVTPIVRAADTKAVAQISSEFRALAERGRAGKLRMDEIDGGSFTISNLGMFGIDQFDAIINPPQGAILALGAGRRRPIEHAGALRFATTVHMSLSCDHRAIDGAVGAKFLTALRDLIEAPQKL
jgi:pyruvate dehydrogenase E2 component (dihydrolipoamide acetyltransferase)